MVICLVRQFENREGNKRCENKMDYNLAALKLLAVHLRSARRAPSQNAYALGGILFQRAWLQGVLVSTPSADGDESGRFILDDGTATIELSLTSDFRRQRWEAGMYLMVVGFYSDREGDLPVIKIGNRCGILKSWKPSNFSTNPSWKNDEEV
ncbi:uncharacterized protein LOC127244297 isoform X2 [Andrographis paniculata]|uniref:uncharacterized protein LOC127244297 isoform X2 n=1 Tax=Andrographis paniculata TaxID=175694 RepID=UPI0021E7EBBF|nr:uncharacterized protein LOC127244297 isoform X2 [Andrographis paniculata]